MSDPMADHLLSRTFDADDVAALRRMVTKEAQEAGLVGASVQDFILAVDEIVTNAVRHGGGKGQLQVWTAHGQLWFRVTDHGSGLRTPTATAPPPPTQVGGRGIWIARQVTDSLDIATGPDGTIVTGAMNLP